MGAGFIGGAYAAGGAASVLQQFREAQQQRQLQDLYRRMLEQQLGQQTQANLARQQAASAMTAAGAPPWLVQSYLAGDPKSVQALQTWQTQQQLRAALGLGGGPAGAPPIQAGAPPVGQPVAAGPAAAGVIPAPSLPPWVGAATLGGVPAETVRALRNWQSNQNAAQMFELKAEDATNAGDAKRATDFHMAATLLRGGATPDELKTYLPSVATDPVLTEWRTAETERARAAAEKERAEREFMAAPPPAGAVPTPTRMPTPTSVAPAPSVLPPSASAAPAPFAGFDEWLANNPSARGLGRKGALQEYYRQQRAATGAARAKPPATLQEQVIATRRALLILPEVVAAADALTPEDWARRTKDLAYYSSPEIGKAAASGYLGFTPSQRNIAFFELTGQLQAPMLRAYLGGRPAQQLFLLLKKHIPDAGDDYATLRTKIKELQGPRSILRTQLALIQQVYKMPVTGVPPEMLPEETAPSARWFESGRPGAVPSVGDAFGGRD